ncbi:MAG: hypothetical protein KDD37_07920 [Bdellovibrionales bacterium]|nr:hypothetical protein [Bdellovibrionales bacterium]
MIESIKSLEKVGFKREQAEAQVKAMSQHTKELVTKTEISTEFDKLRSEIHTGFSKHDAEFKVVRAEMNAGFKEIRSEMNSGFKEIRSEMDARFKVIHCEMKSFLTTKKFIFLMSAFATFLTIIISLLEFRHELLMLLR